MTGSGLGNLGPTPIGIYGQQPWQAEARDKLYVEKAGFARQFMGASPLQAAAYGESFLPSGSTSARGTLYNSSFAGSEVPTSVSGGIKPPNWNDIPTLNFPSTPMRWHPALSGNPSIFSRMY